MKNLVCIALVFSLFAACGDDTPDRTDGFSSTAASPGDSLFDEVMKDHDIAMPKMKQLEKYRVQLDAKADSLKKLKSSGTAALQNDYRALSAELKQAGDDMNKWMDEFVLDSAQDETPQRIPYLTDQKSKIAKVKEDMLSSLAKADSVLNK